MLNSVQPTSMAPARAAAPAATTGPAPEDQAYVDQLLAGQFDIPTSKLVSEVFAKTDPSSAPHKLAASLKDMLAVAPDLDSAASRAGEPIAQVFRQSQQLGDEDVAKRLTGLMAGLPAVTYQPGTCFHYNWDTYFTPTLQPEQMQKIDNQLLALPGLSSNGKRALQEADADASKLSAALHPTAKLGFLTPDGIEQHPNPFPAGSPGSHVLKSGKVYTDYDAAKQMNEAYLVGFKIAAGPKPAPQPAPPAPVPSPAPVPAPVPAGPPAKGSSAEFQADNKILFQAPIISTDGIEITNLDGDPLKTLGGGDYIDLNNNQATDYSSTGRNVTFTEPNLKIPFATLKADAIAGHHGEVLPADLLGNELLQDTHVSWGALGGSSDTRTNPRSLGTLVQQFAPLEKDASYAIDTKTGNFVIYEPKTADSAAPVNSSIKL